MMIGELGWEKIDLIGFSNIGQLHYLPDTFELFEICHKMFMIIFRCAINFNYSKT